MAEFNYEGERRIGLPDVAITSTGALSQVAISLSVGSPLFFRGTIQNTLPGGPESFSIIIVSSDAGQICQSTIPHQRRITLTRPHCGMMSQHCYTSGYTLFEDGTVVYTQREWRATNETITETKQIGTSDFQQLIDAFEQADYFSLQDNYDQYDMSDQPSATTSITLEDKRKSIYHYHGDTSAPEALTELEQKIEEMIDIDIGQPEEGSIPVTLE